MGQKGAVCVEKRLWQGGAGEDSVTRSLRVGVWVARSACGEARGRWERGTRN